jgi:pimeloyl-ACP methyl ester carboxylesterase
MAGVTGTASARCSQYLATAKSKGAHVLLMLSLFLLFAALPTTAFSATGASDAGSLRNLVDIGGDRKLNLLCAGKGSPTLVFLQGAGSSLTTWRKVWPSVSRITRACLYDRAGFGYSDPPTGPIDAISVTDDLHALIQASAMSKPVVLVGHSLGGLYATVYADRFLPDVAGMVLVDPSFSGQFDYDPSELDKSVVRAEFNKMKAELQGCSALARGGKLTLVDNHDCFQIRPDRKPAEIDYLVRQYTRSAYYDSYVSEYLNFFPGDNWTTTDDAEERRFKRPFGDMPLEVLTAGILPDNPHKSKAGNLHFAERWKQGHDALVARSARGISIVVPRAQHEIQTDQPDAVVSSIRRVVLAFRQAHRP